MSEEIDSSYSVFWGQVVPAEKSCILEFPIKSNLTITQAVIPDVDEKSPKEPVRLFAKVQTLIPDEEEDKPEEEVNDAKYTETNVLLATLLPFTNESVMLNHIFSPLNIVEFTNKGKLDIHLSGYVEYLENVEEEEDEEEQKQEKQEEEEKKEK